MKTMKVSERNEAVVREFYHRLENGDAVAAFELFSSDGTWYSPSSRVDIAAAEHAPKIAFFLQQMKDGIRFQFGVFTAQDDRVAVRMTSKAVLINDAVYDQIYHMLFQLRDGEIVHAWEYCDTHHTREVLDGLIDVDALARTHGNEDTQKSTKS